MRVLSPADFILPSLSRFAGHLPQRGRSPADALKILDIGTGSGNIIISLAKEFKKWKNNTNVEIFHFYGSDVSKKAILVAKQNVKKHRVPVKFFHSDLLANVKGNFDIIAANLPYGWNSGKIIHLWQR